MHSIVEILEESSGSAGPDLISLDDLKLMLGIEGTTEDVALQAAITFQSRIIAEYCNRRFGRAEVLETFTFDPGETLREALVLSLYPVAEIAEVSSAGATAADYKFDPASGRLWLGSIGGCWPNNVAVVYSGGYDLPEFAPASLQQACVLAVNDSRIGRSSEAAIRGIREMQHGDVRVAYFTPTLATASSGFLSAMVTDLIDQYRRRYVA